MRLRIVVVLAAAGVLMGAPAFAETFPPLPGMGLAEDAIRGDVARVEISGGSTSSGSGGGVSSAVADTRATPAESSGVKGTNTVRDLPGGGALPLFKEADPAASRSPAAVPSSLAALAALGTLLSVGGFLVLRDRVLDG